MVGGSRAAIDFLSEVELFDPATGRTELVASLHTHAPPSTRQPCFGTGESWWLAAIIPRMGGRLMQRCTDPDADAWAVVPLLAPHGVSHTATAAAGWAASG